MIYTFEFYRQEKMSRFGAKTLLYYHMHPKHSSYILVNKSTYYHPYYNNQHTVSTICTQTHIGKTRYDSKITNEFVTITFYQDSAHTFGCVNSIHYFQVFDQHTISLCISFWINRNYCTIQEHQHGFLMNPVIDELLPYVSLLKPGSVYDLYKQSITWLLPFVTK